MEKVTDELIEKFLSGHCTKEEATIVWAYLQAHPEEGNLENEYEETDGVTPLPEGYHEAMLRTIMEKTMGEDAGRVGDSGNRTVRKVMDGTEEDNENGTMQEDTEGNEEMSGSRIAARSKVAFIQPLWRWTAACVVILLGSWFLIQYVTGLKEYPRLTADNNKTATGPVWITNKNTDRRKISVSLSDGSTVVLSPGSSIRYRNDFGRYDKREIQMQGDAFFAVAKRKDMPFTVYSDGIRTTALGTAFEVRDDSSSDQISVQLYTGKVVVSAAGTDSGSKAQRGFFLSPWEELIFEKRNGHIFVGSFDGRNHKTWKPLTEKADALSNWYMFSDQSLGVVFDQLSAIYNVEIQYPKEKVSNMYFIGKLEPGDSLDKILQDIALLNHLTVTTHNGRYFIATGK